MAHITPVLPDDLSVKFFQIVEIFARFGRPLPQVGHDALQVSDAQAAGIHGVGADVLGLGAGVDHAALLPPVAVIGIAGPLDDPLV